jgi:[ribosomal protein S18]-alanine N-acetyltransferase
MKAVIRPYQPNDLPVLLSILRHNTPRYFDPSEEPDFRRYLEHEREEYFVVEVEGQVVGSGGINYFPQEQLARLSWDLIHPDYHGRGLGRQLTRHRLDRLRTQPGLRQVVVRTSQHAWPFYQKQGFELEKIEKDFWVPGFDLYQLVLSAPFPAAPAADGG